MAPSGYLQVGSPKQRKGIIRPGAVNLRLPLIECHSQVNNGSEENSLTLASSQWTISAAPISSASLYSQASYILSPPVFYESQLDRRRFGIANTPAQEGPWSRPKPLQSAVSSVLLLNLKSATGSVNPFIGKDERVDNQGDIEKELPGDSVVSPVVESARLVPEMNHPTSKEVTNARSKKFRMSTRVLGKMLSRVSFHQSSSRRVDTDKTPLLPSTPSQISILLASPGIETSGSPKPNPKQVIEDNLRSFALEKNTRIPRKPRTRPSTWTPYRPPSPLPKSLRRRGKLKSEASTSEFLAITSPPPLPTRPKIAPAVLTDSKPAFLSFSTLLDRAPNTGITSPVWADIQMRLKARAMKSSTYAVHNGGIISPSSS
ncbi:hypothetical protein C0989_002082 [Termitomyces sp. Mn162]|nr:hypothetical protein C0989_002082 [Termitomyces sp. Mn162]